MDRETKKLVTAALVIIAGSNATGIINAIDPSFRADAFTLTDWYREKAALVEKLNSHDRKQQEKFESLNVLSVS